MALRILPNACGDDVIFVPAPDPCGSCDLQDKEAIANGLVLPDEGFDGLSSVNVAVPNTYTAEDEGKVVQDGALVAQTAHATVTENGTIDTTLNNSVTVEVEGGGIVSPFYILNPTEMSTAGAQAPHILTTPYANTTVELVGTSTVAFAPYIAKINQLNVNTSVKKLWSAYKYTYNNVQNQYFFGRYGDDRSGLLFTTKIPRGVYSKLKLQYEITSGAYSGAFLKIFLQSALGFLSNDVYPDSQYTLYSQTLANALIADNVKVIDISNISNDFYVGFGDYSGFVKLKALWVEV